MLIIAARRTVGLITENLRALHHTGGSNVGADLAIRVLGGVHVDICHVGSDVPEHTEAFSEQLFASAVE